ncbi:MCE family protein [Mycobacterium spongiae]|uniref:MCE family protein n=1 Tax=Mycobacterium spongiae TaxID=886343 RepID=A0A975K0V1_9MYCO|nr:MlaD family protein [Mycobacterium spongiae]QUR68885.1 MCE family protein [Mycobacterium spongiae]
MLTRFIRIQLTIFTIASIIGVAVMAFNYMQAPTLLGIGRMTVTLELPDTGGLYRFSNVTYRGVQVGTVTAVSLTSDGVTATLSLSGSSKIPADLEAQVRSVSAVGERYVDLRPRTDSPPYLRDGSVIPKRNTAIPQPVGPMLDQVSALVESIPKGKLGQLLDEAFQGFNGSGYDLGSFFDSSSAIAGDVNGVADRARTLTDDLGPLLDSQAQTTDSIRRWAHSLAGISDVVANDDSQVRTVLENGPEAANEASRLLDQLKPTLPVLLANLTTVGTIAMTYNPALEQLFVLLPPVVAALQGAESKNRPNGVPIGDFALTIDDPPICTVGFLPPSQWRSPADTTTIDTPDGLYCKLPQDSPLSVRGARNYPCIEHPGKRAPTVEICDSDQPYQPLAMRQHVLGPAPLDPNLLSQGIPPDDRITFNDRIYAPIEGTPLPPGAVPRGTPAGPAPWPIVAPPGVPPGSLPPPAASLSTQSGDIESIAPLDVPESAETPTPGEAGGGLPQPQAAASAVEGEALTAAPTLAAAASPLVVAQYDPHTGRYVGPDGHLYQQSDLIASAEPKGWQDMLPR